MFKKSFLALSVVCLFAIPAFAADWIQVSPNKYVDAASIRPSNAYGTFTFKAKSVADGIPFERFEGKDVWQINGSLYVDCRDAYMREVSYSMYDADNKAIFSNKASKNQWKNIGPNSPTHDLYEYVCRTNTRYDWRRYDRYPSHYYRWWN